MKQEDKDLLLRDLSARLSCGVKVQVYDNRYAPTTLTAIDVKKQECIFNFNVPVENCPPYLRPMSSMTEEELKEFNSLLPVHISGYISKDSRFKISTGYDYLHEDINLFVSCTDWLNAHHFDHRYLIEKGLALEAPEDMYLI